MNDPVLHAIHRWAEKGLVGRETAAALTAEATEFGKRSDSRSAQYALATAAAIVSVIAAATLLRWAWPSLQAPGQAIMLGVIGIGLQAFGLRMEDGARWRPVGYLLQVAGLGILLLAVGHSERAWSDRTLAAMLIGAVALATPLVMIPFTAPRNAFMPAVHTAFGYAFLYLFLDRAVGMTWQEAIWVLDLVLIVSVVAFGLRFRRDPYGSSWAVGALVAGLFSGMVLMFLTGIGPLDRGDHAVLGLDLWYGVVVAITLWGIHQPRPELKRAWYTSVLAWLVLLWIPLGYGTNSELLHFSDLMTAIVQVAVGGIAIAYGLRHGFRGVTYAGCAVVVIAAWVFGIQARGALGGVFALAFTAGLLFWIAGKIGREPEPEPDL